MAELPKWNISARHSSGYYRYDEGANGKGHLTSLTDEAGSAIYNYDILGRMASESRTIAGVTKTMSYTYNLDGSIATMTYPSATPGGSAGDVITYTPDSAGRMLSVADATNNSSPVNYVAGARYNAAGSLTGSIYGQNSSFAGITNTFVYTNRLQPCRMMASTTGAVSPNCDASWGNVLDLRYDFHQGNGNNGNVFAVTNYRDQSRNQTFAYDTLNRLILAQNAGTDCSKTLPDGHTEYWGDNYSYDAWGNLKEKKVTKCQAENLSAGVSANNQLQGYLYDAAGNMTQDNNSSRYVYDAENRIRSTSGFNYIYDADGNRVQKINGNTTPATGTLYWYMTSGIVAESDFQGNLQSEYVFFGGERVARKDFPGNAVSYYFSDHLKTASVITDAVGNLKSESDYYPWGGELNIANGDPNHYKFTGHERDAETGLDYMLARYYSNPLGRFLTPDWAAKPVAIPYAVLGDPQTLNLYTYVRNIPTTRIDPDGHCWVFCPAVGLVGGGGGAVTTALELASGPVGWIVLGTTVIVVGGYLGYKHYHNRQNGGGAKAAAKPAPQSTPAVPSPPPVPGQGKNQGNNQGKNKSNQASKNSNGSNMQPKEGEGGGPGAGKKISPNTQQQALQENQNTNSGQAKCVFCGEDVGEGTNNKINYDHALAKSKGGNNGLNNTNVACEYCNKSKGAGDSPKNPKNQN